MTKNLLAFLIILTASGCKEDFSPEIKNNLEIIAKKKDQIVIIDFDAKSPERLTEKLFRKSILALTAKLAKFKPSVIYINSAFIKNLGGEKEFAERLNVYFPTIIAFEMNSENTQINVPDELKTWIGTRVKKVSRNGISNSRYVFSGIHFPPKPIFMKSRALCYYAEYPNEIGVVEFIYPNHQYGEYFFENCPVTIANEFLFPYKVWIQYNTIRERYTLRSVWGENYKNIKDIDENWYFSPNFIKIKYKKFRKFDAKEFIQNDKIQIDPGYIFIVNRNDLKLKTSSGQSMLISEILANDVYTLLDAVSNGI